MQNLTLNTSLLSDIKNLSTNLLILTENIAKVTKSFTNLNSEIDNSPLFKSIRGFSELANSSISVKNKIQDINTIFKKNEDGNIQIVKDLKLLKNNFIDLGTGIWGTFKNSLSFIGSLITQKGKLQEVIAPMGTFIRRVALSGLTALRAGARMAVAALRGIGVFVANIITATTAQTGFNGSSC